MRKILILVCAFAITHALHAAVPGSYAPVTLNLTAARSLLTTNENADGSLLAKSSVVNKSITHATVLTALQKKGAIPAGSLSGWKLYACFDRYGDFLTLVAAKGTSALLPDMVTYFEPAGLAETGTYKISSSGNIASGSSNRKMTGYLFINVSGVEYHITTLFSGGYNVVDVNSRLRVVKPSPFSSTSVTGFGDNQSVVTGSFSIGTAIAVADLEKVFPNI